MRRMGRIARRVVFGVVVPLLFTLLCLWLVSYFLLNASWARDYVRSKLPPGMEIAAHRFGPDPFDLRVSGLVFGDKDVAVTGGSVVLNTTILPFGIDSLQAKVDEIVVTGDGPKDGPAKPDKEPLTFALSDLDSSAWPVVEKLRGGVGRLWVDLPDLRLFFADVVARQDAAGRLIVEASTCEIRATGLDFAWGASHCVVEMHGTLRSGGLHASVILEDPTGTRVAVYGGLKPDESRPDQGLLSVGLDLAISSTVMSAWTGGKIQGWTELRGLRASGLPLDESPERAALQWDAFRIEALGGPDLGGTGVVGGAGQIQVWPAGILTRVDIEQLGFVADTIHFADLSASAVRLGRFFLSFDKRAEGTLESLAIADWTAPSGVAEGIEANVDFTVGLVGGTFNGLLTSDVGVIGGLLSVKRSPFGGKVSVGAKFDANEVQGALRESLAGDCPGLDAAPLTMRGVDVLFGVEGDPPAVELLRDAATIVSGGKTFVWDGFDWAAPDAEP